MDILRLFVIAIALVLVLSGFGSMWHIISDNPNAWTGFDKSHLFSAFSATVTAFALVSGWLLFELRALRIEQDKSK